MTAILVDGLEISVLDIRAIGEKHELKCAAKNQLRFQLTSSQKKKKRNLLPFVSQKINLRWRLLLPKRRQWRLRLVGWSSLCCRIIHSIQTPQKQNCLQLCLLAVTLPSNYQWEKLDVPIAWRRNGSVLERYFLQSLKGVPLYVESFDKSYNNNLKQRQIDLHIRYWSNEKERVDVRLLNSSFVGKSAAVDYLNVVVLVSKVL